MSGPGNSYNAAQATEATVSQEQLGISQQQNQLSQQNYQRMLGLEQPLIAQETALASGSPQAALRAVSPQIGQVQSGFNAAKEQIMNTVAPGPARDYALAQLPLQATSAESGILGQAVASAPQQLASIGSGFGGLSLQEIGASLSGASGAGTTSANIASQANQSKANQLGLLGSLAGTAGGAFGSFAESPYQL